MSLPPTEGGRHGVALVVSGGGARGAYEAGALSVLLPALEAEDRRPTILLGTSAGAINAAAFASLGHLPAADACAKALAMWRSVDARSVYRPPLGALVAGALARVRGGPAAGATAVLDTRPLSDTLGQLIDWNQLHANVASGTVDCLGLVGTAWSTRRSAVFVEHGRSRPRLPPPDDRRAIDYVSATLEPRHVMASAALPVLFPAIAVTEPNSVADWYLDGGVRLNTPIKPALRLGASRVVVVGTAPGSSPRRSPTGVAGRPASIAGAGATLFSVLLDDRMLEDLRTLAGRNQAASAPGEPGDDLIPWLYAGPSVDDAGVFARLVGQVLAGSGLAGSRPMVRRAFGRLLARDPSRQELLSHIMFDRAFIDGAIELGQRDARRSLHPGGGVRWHGVPGEPGTQPPEAGWHLP